MTLWELAFVYHRHTLETAMVLQQAFALLFQPMDKSYHTIHTTLYIIRRMTNYWVTMMWFNMQCMFLVSHQRWGYREQILLCLAVDSYTSPSMLFVHLDHNKCLLFLFQTTPSFAPIRGTYRNLKAYPFM